MFSYEVFICIDPFYLMLHVMGGQPGLLHLHLYAFHLFIFIRSDFQCIQAIYFLSECSTECLIFLLS